MEGSGIGIHKMTLPKGGGALKGLDGQFGVDLFTGCAEYEIPIYISPCRDSAPKLSLRYRSSSGNGVFGMGFSLGLPAVSRDTHKGIPKYGESDVFILEGIGELVFKERKTGSGGETISVYLPRFENNFDKICFIQTDGKSWWEVTSQDGTVCKFGTEAPHCTVDPGNAGHIFSWKISTCTDRLGNQVRYSYNENGDLECMEYGNYFADDGSEKWLFAVKFTYIDGRKDTFCSYRSGFLIKTTALCTEIAMVHCHTGNEETVRRMHFSYDCPGGVSLLSKVCEEGLRTEKDGSVLSQSMPDLELSYIPLEWDAQEFYRLDTSYNWSLSGQADSFSMVDLYGEGIDGILYCGEDACFYSRPMGNHQYGEPEPVNEFPIYHLKDMEMVKLASLEGNGKYELVVHKGKIHGFYPLKESGMWGGFTPFSSVATMRSGNVLEEADLQGDRRFHAVEVGSQTLCYYPSLGKEGDGNPVICSFPEGFPAVTENSPQELVLFVDVFGDGLAHRVRVKNGSVTCWPNLGYGHFADAVELPGAPEFPEGLDAGRVLFADLNGTGAADLIYIYPDRLDIYQNCGYGFQEPWSLTLPEQWAQGDSVSFHDVNGSGAGSLIFCKRNAGMACYGYDFVGGEHPFLLNQINYNMGMVSKITYQSSADMYFADRKDGIDWEQVPPFPVHLVAEQKLQDLVSDTTVTTKYHYRNGLYDYTENSFSGFGYLEQEITQQNPNADRDIEPVFLRNWYYTGISAEEEYSQCDTDAPVLRMPAYEDGEYRRALYGKCMRTETYGRNREVPADVRQTGYQVRVEMASDGQSAGSLFAYVSEIIHGHYEADSSDPLITHKFFLELDTYGNVVHECKIHYPRRETPENLPAALAEKQACLHVTETTREFATVQGGERPCNLLAQEKRLTCHGLSHEGYFTEESLTDALADADLHMVLFGEDFGEGTAQKKVVHLTRNYYWDSEGATVAPYGLSGIRGLLHHTEEAVFPESYPDSRDWMDRTLLGQKCGYIARDGYWWKVSDTVTYGGSTQFYLPICQESSLPYGKTEVSYDVFSLFPVKLTEYVDENTANQTEAVPDYTALAYCGMKDPNDIVSQVVFDALGQVVAGTSYGYTEGILEGTGDVSGFVREEWTAGQMLSDPVGCMQDMAVVYCYDLLAYQREQKPLCSVGLSRLDQKKGHSQDEDAGRISCEVSYFDGFGRTVQEFSKCSSKKWLAGERSVYDGNGNVLLSYPPYYTDRPDSSPSKNSNPPVRQFFDCMGRLVSREVPDTGIDSVAYAYLLSKVSYTAWSVSKKDENQCLEDSEYYKEFWSHIPDNPDDAWKDKKQAMEQAAKMNGTGVTDILDSKGSVIGQVLDSTGHYTVYEYDGCRQVVRVSDPRLAEKGMYNLTYERDMLGEVLKSVSCDRGTAYGITDNSGRIVYEITPSGRKHTYHYDGLGRMVEIKTDGLGVLERCIYGENAAAVIGEENPKDRNLRGKVVKIQDQAGEEVFEAYGIFGQVKRKHRTFCGDYKESIDWEGDVTLEDTAYQEEFTYDLAGNITRHQGPDGAAYCYTYNLLGQQGSVHCQTGGTGEERELITEQRYHAHGGREFVQYGNQVETAYTYDGITGMLTEMKAVAGDGTAIQSLCYTCEPAGNFAVIRDKGSFVTVNNGQVIKPTWEYIYDEYGRLVQAGGRELAGGSNDFQNLAYYRREYTYDMGGNLCRMAHSSTAGNGTREFEVEDGGNRLTQALGLSVSYGSGGNLESVNGSMKLTYNARGQLAHAVVIARSGDDNDEEFYVYDSRGYRVRKVSRRRLAEGKYETVQTRYVGSCRIRQESSDSGGVSEQTRMGIGNGGVPEVAVYHMVQGAKNSKAQESDEWQVNYMLHNHTDAVNVELDGQGEVISFEEFYPFGETSLLWKSKDKASRKDYRYCGREKDVVTGFYDYGARFYYPGHMRMISADSPSYLMEDEWRSMNLFAYCYDDPVNQTDPGGHCPSRLRAAGGAVVRGSGTRRGGPSAFSRDPAAPPALTPTFSGGPAAPAHTDAGTTAPRPIHYFYGKDQKSRAERDSIQMHAIGHYTGERRSRSTFVREWNGINDAGGSVDVIVNLHGNPTETGKVKISRLDDLHQKNIRLLTLFSCNTANPRGAGNIAQAFIRRGGIEAVVGSRGFHIGTLISQRGGKVQVVHSTVSEFGDKRRDVTPSFILYQMRDGAVVETPLKASYGSTQEYYEDVNSRIAQNLADWGTEQHERRYREGAA